MQDEGYYELIERKYEISAIDTHLSQRTKEIRDWLASISILPSEGYWELSDTYNPDHYYKVYGINGLEDFLQTFNRIGKATIGFDCEAYRYLQYGKKVIYSTDKILNPTQYEAYPTIELGESSTQFKVYQINDTLVRAKFEGTQAMQTRHKIDTEKQIWWELKSTGLTKVYPRITITKSGQPSEDYPLLTKGVNMISFQGSGGNIIPNWREL